MYMCVICILIFIFTHKHMGCVITERERIVCVCARAHALGRVQLFVTPWTVARQAPLSMEFSRQEY